MRHRSPNIKIPFTIISIFFTLFLIFLSTTDIGNWFKKSDYAEWGHLIEDGLAVGNAEVTVVDFGTFPDNDEEFYIVVEIAEPTHEYEFERLFVDVHRIIIEAYLKSDPAPSQPDFILTAVKDSTDFRFGVIAPFQSVMNHVQSGSDYEGYIDTWKYGFDFGDDFEGEQ
jgi:hypothetical protein